MEKVVWVLFFVFFSATPPYRYSWCLLSGKLRVVENLGEFSSMEEKKSQEKDREDYG